MTIDSPQQLFDEFIPDRIERDAGLLDVINTVYRVSVTGAGGGSWRLDLRSPRTAEREKETAAEFGITVDSDALLDIVNGRLAPDVAFMRGQLEASGDVLFLVKLSALFSQR
jgi:hypothetical protein